MQLYAITDRKLLSGNETERCAVLVELARIWANNGLDYIQIREKDLTDVDLLVLSREIVAAVHKEGSATKVLVNGSAEIALAAEANGVHLPGNVTEAEAERVLAVFRQAGREAVLSRACHSVEEIRKVRHASLILYAPVFEKATAEGRLEGQGLGALRLAVAAAGKVPVFALGGVTWENADSCVAAGASGVAAIRMFLS